MTAGVGNGGIDAVQGLEGLSSEGDDEKVRASEERAIEMFKIKKLIKSLERAKG